MHSLHDASNPNLPEADKLVDFLSEKGMPSESDTIRGWYKLLKA